VTLPPFLILARRRDDWKEGRRTKGDDFRKIRINPGKYLRKVPTRALGFKV
jgi:hypothetical protein